MKLFSSVLLLLSLALAIFPSLAAAQESKITLAGLSAPVTVRHDGRGIPYIEAANERDLYFAQGYVTAGDRLWQMDLLRRVAAGETAEIFGKVALEEDKRWRRMGFAAIARESMKHLSPQLRQALESYAAGVNARIDSLDDKTLPIEFRILQYKPRKWEPSDSILIGKILADALSSTWRQDLLLASMQRLPQDKLRELTNRVTPYDVVLYGRDREAARPAVGNMAASEMVSEEVLAAAETDDELRRNSLERLGLFAEQLAASNNWVISGKRTADGKPLLANDPHLMPSTPGIWYLAHLSAPGMRVAGVTFPGVPAIILGHNEHIAWGATNVGPDVQDVYLETFDGSGRYKTPDGWAMPATRTEVIKLRTNSLKPQTEDVDLDVVETRNGVIVLDEAGKRYALKWTARDPKNNEFEAFYALNRAKNWKEFNRALSGYGGAAQNFVYADIEGNIGWHVAGKIPTRRIGDGSLPYDGSTNNGDWTGYIAYDDLPSLHNPPQGFILTANQRVAGTDYRYPQLTREVAAPWRARRIHDLLAAKTKVSMDDVRDIQLDVYNIPLAKFSELVIRSNAASPHTTGSLRAWDGRMTAESKGALLANELRNCVSNRIALQHMPAPSWMIREWVLEKAIADNDVRWLPAGYDGYSGLIAACDKDVRQNLSDAKKLGPDETAWVWGAQSKSRFNHFLASVPFIGAQFATPNVSIAGSPQTPNVGSAVSMRLVTSPGNWDATRHVIPMGQSGDPRSRHYKDQFELWRSGEPAIFPFSPDAVSRASVQTTVLSPAN